MFCRYCGNKLPEDARFCDQCGKPCASITDSDDVDKNADWGALTPTGTTIQNETLDDDVRKKATWEGTTPPTTPRPTSFSNNTSSQQLVNSKPNIISFRVNKTLANEGESLLFSWEVINAYKLRIVMGEESTSVIGESGECSIPMKFNSIKERDVYLYAYDNWGNETKKSICIAYNNVNNPEIIYFNCDKSSVVDYGWVHLSWKCRGAKKVRLYGIDELGSVVPPSGEEDVKIKFNGSNKKELVFMVKNDYGVAKKEIILYKREERECEIDWLTIGVISMAVGVIALFAWLLWLEFNR